MNIKTNGMGEIEALLELAEDAKEMAEFYGTQESYACVDHGFSCRAPESTVRVMDEYGNKARAFLKKWFGEKE